MSSRVKKTKPLSKVKFAERDNLLSAILRSASVMKSPCASCDASGLVCELSPSVSSACLECVRRHEPHYDAQGVTVQQLHRIATQHSRLEDEMEAAEVERAALDAKTSRLRAQKKMWSEKMKRAISRGIDDLEELERVKREEAEALARGPPASVTPGYPSYIGRRPSAFLGSCVFRGTAAGVRCRAGSCYPKFACRP
ncbi:hypothetical protein C8A05DRAFT_48320 [Staphylotrichum tortipilum]|uniref:Uncharacterized protein n=1 Tax=Staphylotrichum tortipilum TaxID=2831512 RepID=A0AAN6RNQ0_9PEZI|nr:hypothetical protein C8A05DRAFT_48320 [Staphylotrichum longicolle]